MNRRRTLFFGIVVALILVIGIVSCAPQTVEVEKIVTQIVKEQVTVMVEGTSVVKEVEVEVVVTATPSAQ